MNGHARLLRAAAAVAAWAAVTLVGQRAGAQAPHALVETVSQGPAWPVAVAAAFMLAVAAWQRWHDIGLRQAPWPRSLRLAWLPVLEIGAALGLAVHAGLPAAGVLAWVLVNTLLVGLSEELAFRGVLLQALRGALGLVPAIVLSTLAFGAVHVLNVFITGDLRGALLQATAAGLSGLLFTALRLRTGSLWPGIVLHALWDFAAFALLLSVAGASAGSAAPGWAPVLLVLPNALYALWLLRPRALARC